MILVIGATGTTGRELTRKLLAGGAQVRALTRHPERSRHALGDGAEVFAGDLLEPATLTAALEGVSKVFLLSGGVDQRQVEMQTNAIGAARKARVAHLVKLSAHGARLGSPVPQLEWHARVETELERSGVPFTILRPNYYMQNLGRGFPQTVRSEGTIYAPMGEGRVSMVDARDVAEVGAEILLRGGYRGERLDLTGPEPLSFQGIATTLSGMLHRTIHYADISPVQARQAMLSNKVPGWQVDAMLSFYEQFAANLHAEVTGQVARVLGRPPRSFMDFARDYLHLFQTTGA